MSFKNLPYRRTDRVAAQMFEIISESFYTDFASEGMLDVQITRVTVAPDLRTARVFFHLLNGNEARKEKVLKMLVDIKGKMRALIRSQMRLKYIPELKIVYDEGVDMTERLERLLSGEGRDAGEKI